jgi:hypothetical protein
MGVIASGDRLEFIKIATELAYGQLQCGPMNKTNPDESWRLAGTAPAVNAMVNNRNPLESRGQ